jgi:hypothetical protein
MRRRPGIAPKIGDVALEGVLNDKHPLLIPSRAFAIE